MREFTNQGPTQWSIGEMTALIICMPGLPDFSVRLLDLLFLLHNSYHCAVHGPSNHVQGQHGQELPPS